MDGIVLIDKPAGMTSHDVVAFFRRRFGLRKVGHAGTLDPSATGLLVILIGRATKASAYVSGQTKEYRVAMRLGARSDTLDREGRITPTNTAVRFGKDEIERVFGEFVGTIPQVPPMYSAVKIGGTKLYELARKGISVDREPRMVEISSLTVTLIKDQDVGFSVVCSKGTYVRQLASDIGDRLGCGAYLTELRRIRSGDFSIEQSFPLDAVSAWTIDVLGQHLVRCASSVLE